MKKHFSFLLCIVLLCAISCAFANVASAAPNLEAVFEAMTVEELKDAQSSLLTILNQKLVEDATLQFSEPNITLTLGKVLKLSVVSDGREITPTTTIAYESADPAVAAIVNGSVKAIAAGTTTITGVATFEDGGVLTAACTVNVIIPVKTLAVTTKSTAVLAGSTFACSDIVTVLPEDATEQKLFYTSSEPEIASIDAQGTLTAIRAGVVTVTITSAESTDKPKSTEVKITILQPVEAITLSDTAINVDNGGKYQLTSTIAPDNASNVKVTWTSSDPTIAKVSATGQVTGVDTGTATISCIATDGSDVTASIDVTVITAVKRITMAKEQVLTEGKTLSLLAEITPNNVTNSKLKWSCDNSSIASINQNGILTASSSGQCTVTAEATDGSGVKATTVVYIVPKLPIYVSSIHWQTTWGVKNGKMGVEAESLCVHRKIKSFDYTVKCYSYYNSSSTVEYLSYSGPAIAPGKAGKSKLTKYSVGGFTNAYLVEITPTKVYYSDGTSELIPEDVQYTSSFSM